MKTNDYMARYARIGLERNMHPVMAHGEAWDYDNLTSGQVKALIYEAHITEIQLAEMCIDERDQRIAELEEENAMLRETRVPDELLAEIISEAEELNRYRPGWELKIKPYRAGHTVSVIEKAQAILDKRREAK